MASTAIVRVTLAAVLCGGMLQSTTVTAVGADRGKAVAVEKCSGCHGVAGGNRRPTHSGIRHLPTWPAAPMPTTIASRKHYACHTGICPIAN